ncbi:addiction module antidote protein [Robbsia andropogonis]|uniref:addiction module antidote protein n=1 Tax=Robbsia andropogonis TaxID=28092 RepID=UPI00158D02B6|nr:addiction module antidote protein [Robbsia andropogonis]
MKLEGLTKFDVADYLDSEEAVAAYLTEAVQEDDADSFILALGTVARSRGMGQLARDAGLGRENLYNALAPGKQPRYETIRKLVSALGLRLSVEAAPKAEAHG